MRFQEIGLKVLGKWDEYKNIEIEDDKRRAAGIDSDVRYWDQEEAFMKSIPIN